jgi:hypothetical protein
VVDRREFVAESPYVTHRWPFAHPEDSRYLAGHCCEFALALKEVLPDAEPVGIGRNAVFPQHVALRLGSRFLDVRGILVEQDFREIAPERSYSIFSMDEDDLMGLAGFASLRAKKLKTALGPSGRAAERWISWASRVVDLSHQDFSAPMAADHGSSWGMRR